MKIAVIQFPGSNCDGDALWAFREVLKVQVDLVWHEQASLGSDITGVVIPGGFSYGDYLRSGCVAAHAPIMASIKRFAEHGGSVLGICNGFQILCEAHLLPGALLPNDQGRFVCRFEELDISGSSISFPVMDPRLRGEDRDVDFSLSIPVANHEGRYFADAATIRELEKADLIAFRYRHRHPDGSAKVNGSVASIAGIFGGLKKNILGMMPHPERACEKILGSDDGLMILNAMVEGMR